MDFNHIKSVKTRYGVAYDDLYIEVRIDAMDGTLIGTINLANTEGWNNWGTAGSSLSEVSGIHDVYFVYQSVTSTLFGNSNWFEFSDLPYIAPLDSESRIEAENYTRNSGTVTAPTTDIDGEEELSSIQNGDWILFEQLDLTELSSIDVRVASPNTGSRIELRTGSYDGDLLTFVMIPNTGSATNWETVNASLQGTPEGKYNVYLIFKGSSGDLMNINWLQFKGIASSVSGKVFEKEIQIYPNPVTDYLTIKGGKGIKAELYNSLGKLISEIPLDAAEQSININGLSSGYYLLRVITPDGTWQNLKMIKK